MVLQSWHCLWLGCCFSLGLLSDWPCLATWARFGWEDAQKYHASAILVQSSSSQVCKSMFLVISHSFTCWTQFRIADVFSASSWCLGIHILRGVRKATTHARQALEKPGQNSEKRWNSLYMIPVCGQLPMMYVYIYIYILSYANATVLYIYITCNYMILCRILQVESYWIAKTPVWIISGISKAQIPLQLDHPSSWCQPSLSFWGLNHLVTWSGSNPQSYPFWGSFWRGIDVTISKNIPYGHQCPWLHMLHIYLGII